MVSSLYFLLLFPRLISAVADWMFTIHGVALVRIYNAGLKCASRGSLKVQDAETPKNRHLGTIAQLCRVVSSQLRHVSTIGKKLVKQQYLLHMPHNIMVNNITDLLLYTPGPLEWSVITVESTESNLQKLFDSATEYKLESVQIASLTSLQLAGRRTPPVRYPKLERAGLIRAPRYNRGGTG